MTGSVVHTGHTAAIHGLLNASGTIISTGADGNVLSWSPEKPSEVRLSATTHVANYSCALVGRQRLLIGTAPGELVQLDLEHRTLLDRSMFHPRGIFDLAALADDRVVCAGGDGRASLWESGPEPLAPYRPVRSIPLSEGKLRSMATSANGDLLALTTGDGPIHVLETDLFNEVRTFTGHDGGSLCVAFHPTKPALVSGGKDGHLRVWSTHGTDKELMSIPAHKGNIYAVVFSPDGQRCATASRDKTIGIWDAQSFELMQRLTARNGGHAHSVNALCWQGAALYSGGDDRKLVRWT